MWWPFFKSLLEIWVTRALGKRGRCYFHLRHIMYLAVGIIVLLALFFDPKLAHLIILRTAV